MNVKLVRAVCVLALFSFVVAQVEDESDVSSAAEIDSAAWRKPHCPPSTLTAGNTPITIRVRGIPRQYILHVPANYTGKKPTPLVVDWHPICSTGPQWSVGSPYPALLDAEGVIMAFPDGAVSELVYAPPGAPEPVACHAWAVGGCCTDGVDDVAFARALVADVSRRACIDEKRVYSVGFSMGGGMTHVLACKAADLFAAVSPAGFDLLQENVKQCKPSRPITVYFFRGINDSFVAYTGGPSALVPNHPINFLGAVNTTHVWAHLNHCKGEPVVNGECQTYTKCHHNVQVTLCSKVGGDHEPGNPAVAWPILKQYHL